ncbi:hypothetical protein ACFQVA_07450 [Actinomadura keratinilytica]
MAVLKESGLVELWDGALRERRATMPSGLVRGGDRHGGYARAMSFSGDGTRLAVLLDADPHQLDGDAVQLWDTTARLPSARPWSSAAAPPTRSPSTASPSAPSRATRYAPSTSPRPN